MNIENLVMKTDVGVQADFIKFYKTSKEAAILKNGTWFTSFPLKAENALKMTPGEYAIGTAFLKNGFGVSGTTATPASVFGVSASLVRNLNAGYRVYIF